MNTPTQNLKTNPWLGYSAHIRRIIPETPGVATYDIVLDDAQLAADFRFSAGQFNMIYLPGLGEIAISISGSPVGEARFSPKTETADCVTTSEETDFDSRQAIVHTIREAGKVTQSLAELSEGDSVVLRGPFGSSWPVDLACGKDLILVAGGIGLAPLRPVIYFVQQNRSQFGNVTLLYGSRTPSGLLYTSEYAEWRRSDIKVSTTVDRSEATWTGNVGVVPGLLDRLPIGRAAETVLMTCGPEVMMWYTIQSALGRGLRPDLMFVSLERNMNCAIGLCGHCQFGPAFICKDGPVLRYDRVADIIRMSDL